METDISAIDAEVLQMLRDDLPGQVARAKAALAAGELRKAAQVVHEIHGSAAFCKMEPLRQACALLEQSLLHDEKNATYIRAFENNIRSVLHALEHGKDD